jgi:guanylate kinase
MSNEQFPPHNAPHSLPHKGIPIVLSAASGTGKTTLSHLLLDSDGLMQLSISWTTRKPRGNEEDGVDYNFVDVDTFKAMITSGAFIEHAEVHGNFYGSSKEWTRSQLDQGKDVLFDIDVQGGKQLKALFKDAVLIFIVPPSMAELEERLRRRGTDSDAVIAKRLAAARAEIDLGLSAYDFVVTNARLEAALADLAAIIRTERIRARDRRSLRSLLLGG